MSYQGKRRRRTLWIAKNYAPREQWGRAHKVAPGVLQNWHGGVVKCARLVDTVIVRADGASKVGVRCVNDAVRRAPGHGAPVCKGPCMSPEAKIEALAKGFPKVPVKLLLDDPYAPQPPMTIERAQRIRDLWAKRFPEIARHLTAHDAAAEIIAPVRAASWAQICGRIEAQRNALARVGHDPGDEDVHR